MNISILHYHLERGGVTQVIDLSIRAMAENLPELEEIRLVSGRSGGAEDLARKLKARCAKNRVDVSLHVINDMDYLPIDAVPDKESTRRITRLKRELLAACSGSIWFIHNYHLGKNPLLTLALLEIAKDDPDQRMCFYIHDFPECARYENLKVLKRFVPESPYAISGNVRYAVINGRDRVCLTEAGVDKQCIFHINNPVQPETHNFEQKDQFRVRLDKRFGGDFPSYTPGAPLLLYPVRTIRRKNILELGLIASLLSTPLNLVVTLPGTSATEIAHSQTVAEAFSSGLIPGMWGIGEHLEQADLSFMDLIATADIIVSSSVQEGFGYLFVNAVQWGIPLFARYLDVLDGIRPVFENHPHHFYSSFRVPVDKRTGTELTKRYSEKTRKLAKLIDRETAERVAAQISTVVGDGTAEFSFLSPVDQLAILKAARQNQDFTDEIVALNPDLIQGLESVAGVKPGTPVSPNEWPFSFEAYAESIRLLLNSFENTTIYRQPTEIQANLMRQFGSLAYLRLLYANL